MAEVRNYVDDIPKNLRAQRKELLRRMAESGVRGMREAEGGTRRDDALAERRSDANYDRGLAIGAPDMLREELDAERRKLLGGYRGAGAQQGMDTSRELDRIAAANSAYMRQMSGASVLNKQRMDQMIEAMKLAMAAAGGGGGGGGGGGDGGFVPSIPDGFGEAANQGDDLAGAAAGADTLWQNAVRAALLRNMFGGQGGLPGSGPAGGGFAPGGSPLQGGVGSAGVPFEMPFGGAPGPGVFNLGPLRIPIPAMNPAYNVGPFTVRPGQPPRPPAQPAVPGLGAAIAAALAAAGQ